MQHPSVVSVVLYSLSFAVVEKVHYSFSNWRCIREGQLELGLFGKSAFYLKAQYWQFTFTNQYYDDLTQIFLRFSLYTFLKIIWDANSLCHRPLFRNRCSTRLNLPFWCNSSVIYNNYCRSNAICLVMWFLSNASYQIYLQVWNYVYIFVPRLKFRLHLGLYTYIL